MGCCCAKEQEDNDSEERTRLLGSTDSNQKSRFLDSSNPANNGMNGLVNSNYMGSNALNSTGSNSSLNGNSTQNASSLINQTAKHSERNHMFEKVLSEVIHVSAFDQRGNVMASDISTLQPVTEDTFKIKGLLEPEKQSLMLPEGVHAPVTILSANPPPSTDIRLINNIAQEAELCISNDFSIEVPDNVAFDFNPVI